MHTLDEQFCAAGDVELCFDTFGHRGDPAVLLIMGLGMQLHAWPDEFCALIAAQQFFVVRYDNRDCGRSTHFDHVSPPGFAALATRRLRGLAYTLDDMADDAANLLTHLGIDAAHVVGASMGAMIGQVLAARRPERVLTLVSMMGNTGARRSGQPSPRMYRHLLRRAPSDRAGYVDHMVRLSALVRSPGFAPDEAATRAQLELTFDRGANPAGTLRQLAAVLAAGDRTEALRSVTARTLIIHGTDDRLVPPSGAWATTRAVPNTSMMLIAGMGHDLPREVWPRVANAIVEHATRG